MRGWVSLFWKKPVEKRECFFLNVLKKKKVGLKIFEYPPLQVKIAVTSYGRASKNQVATMVKKLVKISDKKGRAYMHEPRGDSGESSVESDDEIDAIAIGLTCLASEK